MNALYCCTAEELARFKREGYIEVQSSRSYVPRGWKGGKLNAKQEDTLVTKLPLSDNSNNIVIIGYRTEQLGKLVRFKRNAILINQEISVFALTEVAKKVLDSLLPSINFEIQTFLSDMFSSNYDANIQSESARLASVTMLSQVVDKKSIESVLSALETDTEYFLGVRRSSDSIKEIVDRSEFSLPSYGAAVTYEYLSGQLGGSLPTGDAVYLFLAAFILHKSGIAVDGVKLSDLIKDIGSEIGDDSNIHQYWKELNLKHDNVLRKFDYKASARSPVSKTFLFLSSLLKLCDSEESFDNTYLNPAGLKEFYSDDDLLNAVLPAMCLSSSAQGYQKISAIIEKSPGLPIIALDVKDQDLSYASNIGVSERRIAETIRECVSSKPDAGPKAIFDEVGFGNISQVNKMLKKLDLANKEKRVAFAQKHAEYL